MMGNYEQLKTAVASIIRDNGEEEITGNVLQSVLISIINSVGSGAVFAGIATPSTSPSNPDPNMFYIAVEAGTYPNFNLTVTTGMCIFSNESGTWVGHELGVSSQFESGEYITEVSITDTLEGAETDNLPTVGAVNEAVTAFNTAIATERQDRQEADGNQTVALNLEKTLRQQGDEANSASVGYYICDTAAATAAKAVNASGYVLRIGGNIRIEMTHANTADNATLNINSTGAKALYYNGAQASASNSWDAGEVLEVFYDGTQYQCASGAGGAFVKELEQNISIRDTEDDSEEIVITTNDNVPVVLVSENGLYAKKMLDNKGNETILFDENGVGVGNYIRITDDNGNVVMEVNPDGVVVSSISTMDGGSADERICVPIFKNMVQNLDFSLFPINGNMAVIGDSTVAGYGVNRRVSANLTITGTLTDISTAGDTVNGQKNKWNALSSSVKSDLDYVIVEIGLNDMTGQTLASDVALFNNYQALIKTIRNDAPNSKIILSKMTPAHKRFLNIYGAEGGEIAYNNWLELNDAIERMLFYGADISVSYHVNIMGDNYGNLIAEYDNGDAIHPNVEGGKVIAWSWLTGIYKYKK